MLDPAREMTSLPSLFSNSRGPLLLPPAALPPRPTLADRVLLTTGDALLLATGGALPRDWLPPPEGTPLPVVDLLGERSSDLATAAAPLCPQQRRSSTGSGTSLRADLLSQNPLLSRRRHSFSTMKLGRLAAMEAARSAIPLKIELGCA
jgi:hypothetical protein